MDHNDTAGDPIICPVCGGVFATDATLWVVHGRWYCSEGCARAAAKVRDG